MAESFISPAEAADIKEAFSSLFATSKLLGRTVNLTLWRDSEMDGTAVEIEPQAVKVVMAKREASEQQGQASAFVGADGELQKEPPFDVRRGDRFTLDGMAASISVSPIHEVAYIRAAFVLEG